MKLINHPFRLTTLLLTVLAIFVGFTSCNSDDDGPVVFNVQEFATFAGNNAGRAEFQVQRTGNGPVYTLYSSGNVNEANIPAGSRVLLAYQLTSENAASEVSLPTSGEIDLISVAGILTLTPKIVNMEADSLNTWDFYPVYMDQIYRTGAYINLIARVDCNQTQLNKTFDLFADSASMYTDEPKLYLRYNQPEAMSTTAYVPTSLNISTIWNNPAYEGVVFNVKNSNQNRSVFQFLRNNENYTD